MKTKKPILNLKPKDVPALPLFVPPNAQGDAIGDATTDPGGVAMAQQNGTAQISKYGVAYCPNGGTAHAGAQGAAVVHNGIGSHLADAGDGAMAYVWNGIAQVTSYATAFAIRGDASAADSGVAVVMFDGSAKTLAGGVACAMNNNVKLTNVNGYPAATNVTDPKMGVVSGGKGSVVVAFTKDKDGNRIPVVGFIGSRPQWFDDIVNLESRLLDLGVQFGLKPGVKYRLNSKNRFEPVPLPQKQTAKRKK